MARRRAAQWESSRVPDRGRSSVFRAVEMVIVGKGEINFEL